MEFLKHFIIFIAIAIGSLMLYLGIKEITVKNSKKGSVFWSTLLAVLLFSNCANAQKDTDNSFQYSQRINNLNKTIQWQEFKAFWQELDNQSPSYDVINDNGHITTYDSYMYGNLNNSNTDTYDAKTKELENLISEIKQTGLVNDDELAVLEALGSERINNLYTINSSLFLHIAPPKINQNYSAALEKLEYRIDTLLTLSNNNLISKNELDKALENIHYDIKNILIINTILSEYTEYMFEGSNLDDNTIENNLNYFEEHFKKLIAKEGDDGESKKIYEKIKKQLDNLDKNLTTTYELINDLTTNKSTRITHFEQTDIFKSFKKYWTEIDNIKITPNLDNYTYGNYVNVSSYINILPNKIDSIKQTKLFSEIEIEMLEQLTLSRLEALRGPNMYTRAIMTTDYTPHTIFEFENKIDALLELKNKGLINSDEYKKVLPEIFNLSKKSIMIKIINENFFYRQMDEELVKDIEPTFENYKAVLEKHYKKLIEQYKDSDNSNEYLTENYTNSLKKLNEVSTAFSTLNQLINSFEK